MEKVKKQFSEITKSVREKNNLTQSDMASKLYLSSKQIIYYYEKSERIMKLPEFVEFIQKFNETVVIDKDGMSLVEKDLQNIKAKEHNIMQKENKNFVLIEKIGEVSFYEDSKNKKQYQQVVGLGLIPVKDGEMEYKTIQTFGDISIKYNLNGSRGYSIWLEDKCYEDNFWSFDDIKESVNNIFIASQKEKVVSVMTMNVQNKLEDENIKLTSLDFSNVESFVDSLDNLLQDDGLFICFSFMDIAIPYALNFGEMDSDDFIKAQWECIEEVCDFLGQHSGNLGYSIAEMRECIF